MSEQSKQYTCDSCGVVFQSMRSDEEARDEALANFGADVFESQEMSLICDDCYREFMPWFLREEQAPR